MGGHVGDVDGVVLEGHGVHVGQFFGEEVTEPEGAGAGFGGVCPGAEGIAVEAVDGDDAVFGCYWGCDFVRVETYSISCVWGMLGLGRWRVCRGSMA